MSRAAGRSRASGGRGRPTFREGEPERRPRIYPEINDQEIEDHPSMSVLPLDARVTLESTRLGPAFPRDPADQIIAATARVHGLRLVTADDRIRGSGVVSVV